MLGGINLFRKNSKLGIQGFFWLSKPCIGELDVLEYRAAHSKGTFIPPRSLFYIRQFIVEKILPKVEFLFYFLRRKGQGFVSKINEIGML